MEWRLRNQTVRRRHAEKPSNKGSHPEEKKVPVESSRLTQRELGILSNQRRHVGVKVEQNPEHNAKGEGHTDIAALEVPELDKPLATPSRLKRALGGR